MENEKIEIIQNVFCDVFEQLAFMFGEPVENDELAENNTRHLQAYMTFSGDRTGEIIMTVPDKMCPEIAANVLGVEPDDEQVMDLAGDALKEILNITCGQLLTAVAGERPVFDLSVPEVRKISSRKWSKLLKGDESLGFMVDDYPVLLNFRLDP